MAYLSDIEIAQQCEMRPIQEIAAKAHVEEKYLELYGRYKAKIDPARIPPLLARHRRRLEFKADGAPRFLYRPLPPPPRGRERPPPPSAWRTA